ncbi:MULTISPECIES: hypothetical protein [unclassified Lentimonas]|uniref:hypothetical protein n=1 Tax=unclassified Lentimonas TaxID=2630993 RepID=UPI00132B7310|nr:MULTISPECIES: hypothetical protein [unclassified Lentimonas]CAA6679894.1 Unannotated [Lentimonas sp. CC4]CAA6683470.1 Unannotated [Lentimonas sp. CC6]CAA6691262.1 Unannotated [Lentimonas sp. CC10]CAA6695888.1 Unannotated [Lentimonas sp. CC19]CAA7068654.1 Unannotated [Lentimonas sp. CC11]
MYHLKYTDGWFAFAIGFIAFLSIFSDATAQNPKVSASVEFSCVIWNKLPYETLYYRQDGEYLPLKLSPNNRSPLYDLSGMEAFELYIPGLDETGQPAYKLVGQSALLPDVRRLLFFIVERPKDSGLPLGLLGIDDSLNTFPPGTTRFVNMSSEPLVVSYGDKNTLIPIRSMKNVKSNAPAKGGFMPFLVTDEQGDRVYETRLMSRPTGRDMVFILPSERRDRSVELKFIPQIIPPNQSVEE